MTFKIRYNEQKSEKQFSLLGGKVLTEKAELTVLSPGDTLYSVWLVETLVSHV